MRRRSQSLVLLALGAGCAHSSSLSGGASDVPVPGVCNTRDAAQGPGALVSAFAAEAGLPGGELLVIAGDAMVAAAQRDLPGVEAEFFLTEGGCLELVYFRQIVEAVADPILEVSLAEARAVKPAAIVGGEIDAPLSVGLSPVGERILTGQSLEPPEGRAALVAELAEGIAVRR